MTASLRSRKGGGARPKKSTSSRFLAVGLRILSGLPTWNPGLDRKQQYLSCGIISRVNDWFTRKSCPGFGRP